jgi:protein involved in polysaccharide export with SLBB domain
MAWQLFPRRAGAGAIFSVLAAVVFLGPGCACHKDTVPAAMCGPSICESPRGGQQPINLIDLRLNPPQEYRLGAGDLLAIYIEGLQGNAGGLPPVNIPQQEGLLPAAGYPVPVREDGTIALPLIDPLEVQGQTLPETEDQIRQAYSVRTHILPPERSRVVASVMRKRTFHVLVVRQDRAEIMAAYTPGQVVPEPAKIGQAHALELAAYENDVLHALVASGGLPGVSARNEVIVLRGAFKDPNQMRKLMIELQDPKTRDATVAQLPNLTRIPLRVSPCSQPLGLNPQDIILGDGDVVVIESRANEVFYTGGLLKGGQYPLPRDYDLDVLGAIAMAGGSIGTAAGGTATSAGVVVAKGGGIFPPTRVTVLRMAQGRQIPIHVDLNRAMEDPHERVLIQPDDFILLEYTTPQLIANLVLNNVFVSFSFTKNL